MRLTTLAALGALAPAALACGPKSVQVSITLVTSGCPGADGGTPANALKGVSQIEFDILSDADGGPFELVNQLTTSAGAGAVTLPPLPLGPDRIHIKGLSDATASAKVLAVGDTGVFTVPGDGSVSSLSVTAFVRRTDGSVFTNDASNPGKCTQMTVPRAYHSQALLADGTVLIYGGLQYSGTIDWTQALAIPPMPITGPQGASFSTNFPTSAEIYNPLTGQFSSAGRWQDASTTGGIPSYRAFASMLAYAKDGAVVLGGDFWLAADSSATVFPAWEGAIYSASNSPQWDPVLQTDDDHDRGCLVQDTEGHALLTGGYNSTPVNTIPPASFGLTAKSEYLDPGAWPPSSLEAGPLTVNDSFGPGPSRAEQACTGFDGVMGITQTLVVEAGGTTVDPAGNWDILGDFDFYTFGKTDAGTPDFLPYVNGSLIAGALTYPRSRAKAVAMTVTEDGGTLQDAILVTGGLTCTPAEAGSPCANCCTPAYVNNANGGTDGGAGGQLANPPYTYFEQTPAGGSAIDVGQTTDLIHFPIVQTPNGPSNEVTVNPGPAMAYSRIDHCAVALPDGRAVLIGGLGEKSLTDFGTLDSIEVVSDNPKGTQHPDLQVEEVPGGLQQARAGMACTLLPDGSILVTGGFQTTGALNGTTQPVTTLSSAEIFYPLPISVTTQ